ncbi:Cytochrome c mitochondrial import factor CYC2 [Wickerhamiella sorbophila]|uniref:Cytochrome c mitochondrial import factor CYC2 n=1 Tax=Wickerhamiella sorbophila TaxID=45607 RepID=A0A2T0FJS1_9ASCO|nr:Cytochrome c mitochondrial import factor CYC2 [Wickerhamiella sorbophila]PRT55215.1 Cytochrome c mitochondrial import factor CYC2 [Wickerhamiella sorbophila]
MSIALRTGPIRKIPVRNFSSCLLLHQKKKNVPAKKSWFADESQIQQKRGPTTPIQRVTYEYPPPPKAKPQPPPESSAWRKHIPMLVGVAGVLWAGYALNYIFNIQEGEQTTLTLNKFTAYKITYREQVGPNLIAIELSPKYSAHMDILTNGGTLWNGKKLWSVQVKHPEIQIARKYTPLPLYYMQSRENGEEKALLRILGSAPDEGRLVLVVKKYDDGEMSRYLHSLPVGSEVELRGPYVEHKFPYTHADMSPVREPMLDLPTRMKAEKPIDPAAIPDNIAFFTAGTGIAPALQTLLSRNPPKGFTHVYHSVRSRQDIPFTRFMLFLEKVGRAKFHFYVDDENKFLTLQDIPKPVPKQPRALDTPEEVEPTDVQPASTWPNAVAQFADKSYKPNYLKGPSLAVVCGPPGYIAYVAGNPGFNNDAPVAGLLGESNWTSENVTRMSEF